MANNSLIKTTIRNLGPLAQALTSAARRVQSNLYQPPAHRIEGVDERNWPSALQPVAPIAPPGSAPLGLNFLTGQNLIYTPRADAEYKADELKRLASYPLARICIENVKDQISAMPWKIQAKRLRGESHQEHENRQKNDKVIDSLTRFFEFPDPEHDWAEWLRPLLEDMLVLDAPTIYLRRTNDGKEIVELRVLPGESIVRYIDDNGFTPQAPSVAYAQLWDETNSGSGIPRVEFTTDQLVYKPRNIVRGNTNSSQLYGCSPTEQLATEIKIGIERLKYVLAYYMNGSTPGLVHIVPNGTPADKIREAMEWMNSELAGNLAARRQWRMMQGFTDDGKDNVIQLQEPILADAFDELHIRKICFGYGTSPQRLLRMMNRATASENQDAAEEEGLRPWMSWLTGVVNFLIQRKFGLDGYEMVFSDARAADKLQNAQADEIDVKNGIRTRNEVREERGYDPRPEPMASTIECEHDCGGEPKGKESTSSAVSEDDEEEDEDPDPDPAGKKQKKLFKSASRIPRIDPQRSTRVSRAAQKSLERAIHRHFAKQSAQLIGRLKEFYPDALTKVRKINLAKKDDPKKKALIDELIDLDWDDLIDDIEGDLVEVSMDGSRYGLDSWYVTERSLINSANSRAAEYAHYRAAEMVGRKWVNGELVDNPDASKAISQTTRSRLREIVAESLEEETPLQDVVDEILGTDIFSEARAKMIAQTETATAMVRGTLIGWEASGVVETIAWELAFNHPCCDQCDQISAAGPYPIDELPEFPAHPYCICYLVPKQLKGETQADTKKVWTIRLAKAYERMAA